MPSPLKDRPIALGVISNFIFQFLWNGVPAIGSLIAAYSAHAGGQPLYLIILLGAFVFFLLSFAVNWISLAFIRHHQKDGDDRKELSQQKSIVTETGCHDKWLHDIAEHDKREIDKVVQVTHHILSHDLRSATPHLKFHFTVFNGSVYPISINRKIEGYISYGEVISQRRLVREITVSTMLIPKNCPHGQMASLEFTQWLTEEETKYIKESNSYNCYLSLDNLIINITGGDGYENIKLQPLQLVLINRLHINK